MDWKPGPGCSGKEGRYWRQVHDLSASKQIWRLIFGCIYFQIAYIFAKDILLMHLFSDSLHTSQGHHANQSGVTPTEVDDSSCISA